MTFSILPRWRWAIAVLAVLAAAGGASAMAQIPSPPSTVFGSITDEAGVVPENLPVQGYIGDNLCGTRGRTEFTGEGAARVTVYFVDVLSAEQTPGCGRTDAVVRIKIGDRFATQTTRWNAGPVQLNITFGNATPAPIPTFTPAPRPSPIPTQVGTPVPQASATAVGTIPAGSPGAGSPIPTLKGGLTSSTTGGGTGGDDAGGGFPLWGVALLGLVGLAAVGGGVGYAMSRAGSQDADDSDVDFTRPL